MCFINLQKNSIIPSLILTHLYHAVIFLKCLHYIIRYLWLVTSESHGRVVNAECIFKKVHCINSVVFSAHYTFFFLWKKCSMRTAGWAHCCQRLHKQAQFLTARPHLPLLYLYSKRSLKFFWDKHMVNYIIYALLAVFVAFLKDVASSLQRFLLLCLCCFCI